MNKINALPRPISFINQVQSPDCGTPGLLEVREILSILFDLLLYDSA
jgi:hypothetical protein